MTFTVNLNDEVNPGPGNRQVRNGCLNLVSEFAHSIGGWKTLELRDRDHTPKCDGITEWAEKKYGIQIVDKYRTRFENHAHLSPNPMDGVDRHVMDWACDYIPYWSTDPPWGHHGTPSPDEVSLFLDPVFVGPRSPADRKFFHSQRIKIGLRKKQFGRRGAYEKCQTPELRNWQQDVTYSRLLFADSGLEAATNWATSRGWKEGRFWQTKHIDVDRFEITMPGCEGKPDTYEKLLFVLKFGGGN